MQSICDRISSETTKLSRQGLTPVILVSPQIRPGLKQMSAPHLPRLVVMSYNEVTRDTRIESHGLVSDAPAKAGV